MHELSWQYGCKFDGCGGELPGSVGTALRGRGKSIPARRNPLMRLRKGGPRTNARNAATSGMLVNGNTARWRIEETGAGVPRPRRP